MKGQAGLLNGRKRIARLLMPLLQKQKSGSASFNL